MGWKAVSAVEIIQINCWESTEEEALTASGRNQGGLPGRHGPELNSKGIRLFEVEGTALPTEKRQREMLQPFAGLEESIRWASPDMEALREGNEAEIRYT